MAVTQDPRSIKIHIGALGSSCSPFFSGDDMRVLLIIWTLLGTTMGCIAQTARYSDVQPMLWGRWFLSSADTQFAVRDGEYITIESRIIRMKRDCNEDTFVYSIKGDELRATPVSTTLVACRFSGGNQLIYDALLHSRFKLDGNVLHLFSLSDSPFEYNLEFRREL